MTCCSFVCVYQWHAVQCYDSLRWRTKPTGAERVQSTKYGAEKLCEACGGSVETWRESDGLVAKWHLVWIWHWIEFNTWICLYVSVVVSRYSTVENAIQHCIFWQYQFLEVPMLLDDDLLFFHVCVRAFVGQTVLCEDVLLIFTSPSSFSISLNSWTNLSWYPVCVATMCDDRANTLVRDCSRKLIHCLLHLCCLWNGPSFYWSGLSNQITFW